MVDEYSAAISYCLRLASNYCFLFARIPINIVIGGGGRGGGRITGNEGPKAVESIPYFMLKPW